MKAHDIAAQAAKIVHGDRERTHGPKYANHQKIAEMWNAYMRIRKPGELEALDVALMMALLKIARSQLGAYNPDDYVDLVGYGAVAGEIAGIIDSHVDEAPAAPAGKPAVTPAPNLKDLYLRAVVAANGTPTPGMWKDA